MSHYKSNVRDQVFNLFEVLGLDKALGQGEYSEFDADTVREMLTESARLAEGPIAASYVEGDRNPPVFDPETHTVSLPRTSRSRCRPSSTAAGTASASARSSAACRCPESWCGPSTSTCSAPTPPSGCNGGGAGFAQITHNLGTEEQQKWATFAAERGWGSTMVLTEPDAGSDVGAGRTKAVKQDDGSWHIDGVKRFITSADSDDLFENILHLVLARPEGAGPGTKGLSLFLVPKFLFDPETGAPGERNGVFVTNVEHKMGLKVSATCG